MIRSIQLIILGVLGLLWVDAAHSQELPLLNVKAGQLPNDTGFNDRSELSIEANRSLGGKALKVVFAKGDSFGMKDAGPSDWANFAAVEFSAYNPARDELKFAFSVKHRRTTSYNTRVELPFTLKPGANKVTFDVGDMANVDGSAPDLKAIRHWFIASPSAGPTVYFGDIVLKRRRTATPSSGAAKATLSRLERIRAAKMPKITKPVQFDTPEADAILSALEIFPPDNAFNQDITNWPLHPNSKNIIASIGVTKPLRYNPDMSFILVPPTQPRTNVRIVDYPAESDRGPYPFPSDTPIEGWPAAFQRNPKHKNLKLLDVQRDIPRIGGDRHAIVVDPLRRKLYEFYIVRRTSSGWQAAQASIFDLSSNRLRPQGWTSADAAGLPIFPAVVRYDELKRGVVEHAMRMTVRRSRRAYVHPATHYASRDNNPNLPRMGERIRLRRDVDVSRFSPEVRAILIGLKKHGMFVADNGLDWSISVTPDPRIPSLHEELRSIRGRDFEVVVSPQRRGRR